MTLEKVYINIIVPLLCIAILLAKDYWESAAREDVYGRLSRHISRRRRTQKRFNHTKKRNSWKN